MIFSVTKVTLLSKMSVHLSVCLSVCKTPEQPEIIILHHTSFIIHHSSFILHHPSSFFIILHHSSSFFIILHLSFLHFATFKFFSLFIQLKAVSCANLVSVLSSFLSLSFLCLVLTCYPSTPTPFETWSSTLKLWVLFRYCK